MHRYRCTHITLSYLHRYRCTYYSPQTWRWVGWWNAVFFGIFFVLTCFCYEETKYCPLPSTTGLELSLSRSQDKVSESKPSQDIKYESTTQAGRSTGPAGDASRVLPKAEEGALYHRDSVRINPNIPRKTYWQRLAITNTTTSPSGGGFNSFLSHLYRPFILLTTIPAIAYTALVYGILVATSDVMSTIISLYMIQPPYNFTSDQIGLMNLSRLPGSTLGLAIVGPVSDYLIIRLSRRNGIYEPEARLWSMAPFLPLIPAGALLFGLGLQKGLPWPVIAVALALFKLGMGPVSSITITYLTDSYQDIIGDSIVAVTVVRNVFSTAFIFALDPWINAIGIRWVLIILVLITAVILSLTGIFIKYGKGFRVQTAARYQRYAQLQYKER